MWGREVFLLLCSHAHIVRGRAPTLPNFGGSLLFLHAHFVAELPNFKWQHMVRWLVFRGQQRFHPKGAGPQRSTIFRGFLYLIYSYILWRRTTKFDVVTPMGSELVSRESATAPSKRGGAPALRNFRGLLYLWLHSLQKDDQIGRGNTLGRACFRRSATPLFQGGVALADPSLRVFRYLSIHG